MTVDAFVFRGEGEGRHFLTSYLASADFSKRGLEHVCNIFSVNLPSQKKSDIVDALVKLCVVSQEAQEALIQQLLNENKRWAYVQLGRYKELPKGASSRELLIRLGEERWYGPIKRFEDEDAEWYIRPVFIPHWELQDFGQNIKRTIRWLCYARVCYGHLSLHWNGFSHSISEAPDRPFQFEYWSYVPRLFAEFERLTKSKYESLNLEHLVLHTLWDQYRGKEFYEWKDRTIHAESGGISLNARAIRGGFEFKEQEIRGIERLAKTIRGAIDEELRDLTEQGLPRGDHFDEIILRTLIREYGPLSYEVSLQKRDGTDRIFRAHVYFGNKASGSTPDTMSHIRFYYSWRHELEQLNFLLDHVRSAGNDKSEPKQFSLF